MKWRLLKHKSIHDSDKNRPCHYYNNNKVCPFEELGCKFAHKISGECKYSKACKNKLCSFEHGKIVLGWGDQSECDLCEFQFKTDGEIYTHIRNVHRVSSYINKFFCDKIVGTPPVYLKFSGTLK